MFNANKKKHIARGIGFGILFLAFFSLLIFLLWNWLMPEIFGLTTISYIQAVGLLILSKILFFGFHRKIGPSNHFKAREYWRKKFEDENKARDEGLGGEKV